MGDPQVVHRIAVATVQILRTSAEAGLNDGISGLFDVASGPLSVMSDNGFGVKVQKRHEELVDLVIIGCPFCSDSLPAIQSR